MGVGSGLEGVDIKMKSLSNWFMFFLGVSACLGGVLYRYDQSGFDVWLPRLQTIAEVSIPVYILSLVTLFLLHRGYGNRVVSFLASLTKFSAILAIFLVADYILSGRYKDGVDLIGGFMDMDFGWPIAIAVIVFGILAVHHRKDSWVERKE